MSAAGLGQLEQAIDTSGVAGEIEARLPVGVRRRQLSVRTLLIGLLLVAADRRPMFVRNIHKALVGLPAPDKLRLGVIANWNAGPHQLTYRQTERTFRLVRAALSKLKADGAPSQQLQDAIDALIEASAKIAGEPDTNSYAADWTDLEAWARPPRGDRPSADPDAAWGHRTANHPAHSETFFGYYLQALTAVKEENGPDVPGMIRRITISSPKHDPPAQLVPVIERTHHGGTPITELLVDCGYSYREPATFALPIRRLQVKLIMELHPNDRGPKGTHHGAIITNGNLYCPATPKPLLELSPLPPGASEQQTLQHDQQCAELARYKLAPIAGPDPDGYRRVACPATTGKLRCPHKPASLTLPLDRPTIPNPPPQPPVCCAQRTTTVPPSINAKTTQKHDYPSPQHRRSYNRRTAAERSFSTLKDRASDDLTRGFCRLTDLAGISLLTAAVITARNLRIADAHRQRERHTTQHPDSRHTTTRRRRRQHTLQHLLQAADSSP